MSQTFTSPADWSDYFHATPPTTTTTTTTTASIISSHHNFAANSAAMAAPTTDLIPTSFSFNSGPPSTNKSTNPRANRVTKPVRKRSRASRRTPTTLLSTDTSNFRAMVQQFTGGPSALGFGIGGAIDHLPSSSPFAFPSGYSNFQFQQQQQGAASIALNGKNDGGGPGHNNLHQASNVMSPSELTRGWMTLRETKTGT